MVLRECLVLAAGGILVGVPAALLATPVIASRLYRVGASDPLVIAGAVICLVLVAALAAFLPAYRAARIDPMAALRFD
jgi:ABC-type antimicrobial peptide transport system permease subunit